MKTHVSLSFLILMLALLLASCGGSPPTDTIPPAKPTGLSASAGDAQVILNWDANSEADLGHYNVYQGTAPESLAKVADVPAGTETYTATDLTNGTPYFFAIDAEDASSNTSAKTAEVSATPTAGDDGDGGGGGSDTTPPTVVSTVPADGATEIALNSNISIEFSEAMDTAATEAAISANPAITCDFSWNDAKTLLTCNPNGNLTASETYTVTLGTGAKDAAGNALASELNFSFTTGATADTTPPAKPQNLTTTAGDTQVILSWDANSEADVAGYNVYWGTTSGNLTETTFETTTSITIDGLANGTEYFFAIDAEDSSGNKSPKSDEVSTTPVEAPAKYLVKGNSVSGYGGHIYVYLDGVPVTTANVTINSEIFPHQGNGRYTKSLDTVVPLGGTLNLEVVIGAVTITGTDTVPERPTLSAPAGGEIYAPTDTITVSWTSPSDPDRFMISAGYSCGDDCGTGKRYYVAGNARTVDIPASDLPPDKAIRIEVYAYNDGEFTGPVTSDSTMNIRTGSSGEAIIFIPSGSDTAAPAAPTGLTATAGNQLVELTWNASTEADLYDYVIYQGTTSGDLTKIDTVDAETLTYTAEALTNGTTYYFVVSARDKSGKLSAFSAEVSATPIDLEPPATPTGLVATAGDSEIVLTWNASTEADLDHFNIYLRTDATDYGKIGEVSAGTETYTRSGLANGATFYFSIDAVDAVGNKSPKTSEVSAVPADSVPPETPTGFSLSVVAGEKKVTLTWDANGESDLSHYKVYQGTYSGSLTEVAEVPAGTQTYVATGLTYGTEYFFSIIAEDTSGNPSPQTLEQSATPTPPRITDAWLTQFGASGFENVGGLTYVGDKLWIVGWLSYSSGGVSGNFLAKYGQYGGRLRLVALSLPGYLHDIAVDSVGNYYVVGNTFSAFPGQTQTGTTDAYVAKFDSAGTQQWVRQIGVAGQDSYGYAVAVTSTGEVYLSGHIDGGAFPGQPNTGSQDAFIVKYDAAGAQQWVRQFGVAGQDWVHDLVVNGSEVVALGQAGGQLPGSTTFGNGFMRRYDASGAHVETLQFDVPGTPQAMTLDADGNVWSLGYSTHDEFGFGNEGSSDMVLGKLEPTTGDLLLAAQLGTSDFDGSAGLALNGTGAAFVLGYTAGGFPTYTNAGYNDIFIARLQ